ncbi:hypothetical protein ACFV2H_03470 [Streptomyces sp. NPDC059629]|uniref:hypothetical protein n=1 Tax=Streptomyces sp. NPDC059629 TaxID=3346889 RepID=UPI0036CFC3FC
MGQDVGLDVSGPSEVLHQAGRLADPYELVLVSPAGGTVTTSAGLTRHLGTTPTHYRRRFATTGGQA